MTKPGNGYPSTASIDIETGMNSGIPSEAWTHTLVTSPTRSRSSPIPSQIWPTRVRQSYSRNDRFGSSTMLLRESMSRSFRKKISLTQQPLDACHPLTLYQSKVKYTTHHQRSIKWSLYPMTCFLEQTTPRLTSSRRSSDP